MLKNAFRLNQRFNDRDGILLYNHFNNQEGVMEI